MTKDEAPTRRDLPRPSRFCWKVLDSNELPLRQDGPFDSFEEAAIEAVDTLLLTLDQARTLSAAGCVVWISPGPETEICMVVVSLYHPN